MSATDLVKKWHAERPEWTKHFTARDWSTAEAVAAEIDAASDLGRNIACDLAPAGSYCVGAKGHDGPCETYPV